MNVGQLRRTLANLADIYRDSGDIKRAKLLATFSNLLDGDQELPLARFVQRIDNAWRAEPRRTGVGVNAHGHREKAQSVK
jgi:hypothetical protein